MGRHGRLHCRAINASRHRTTFFSSLPSRVYLYLYLSASKYLSIESTSISSASISISITPRLALRSHIRARSLDNPPNPHCLTHPHHPHQPTNQHPIDQHHARKDVLRRDESRAARQVRGRVRDDPRGAPRALRRRGHARRGRRVVPQCPSFLPPSHILLFLCSYPPTHYPPFLFPSLTPCPSYPHQLTNPLPTEPELQRPRREAQPRHVRRRHRRDPQGPRARRRRVPPRRRPRVGRRARTSLPPPSSSPTRVR